MGVKELADWEEGASDANSYEIGFDGKRYLVGRLAQLMGGTPAFESGKADLAHLLVLPALASDSQERIERLVIPTPDSRNLQTIAKLKEQDLRKHAICSVLRKSGRLINLIKRLP